MATNEEIRTIENGVSGDALRNKIAVAVMVKAHALLQGTPSSGQRAWADEALENPMAKVPAVFRYMLAASKGSTVAQITGASDAVIQTNTDTAVDQLVA